MILKEAFRYQNYLGSLISSAVSYLGYADNVTIVTQEHKRSLVYSEGQDETVVKPKRSDLEYKPNVVIDFLVNVLVEKEKLSNAIDNAKTLSKINIDSSIAMNKQKQSVINTLSMLSNIKGTEKVRRDNAYKFNGEGNQVPYTYDVKEVVTIDFDRNKVKGIIKKLRNETDETSSTLDKLQVELNVDYTPVYDLNDSFEDALAIFAKDTGEDTKDTNKDAE